MRLQMEAEKGVEAERRGRYLLVQKERRHIVYRVHPGGCEGFVRVLKQAA